MKALLLTLSVSLVGSAAFASGPVDDLPPAKCVRDFRSFQEWKNDFRREALANGISVQTWEMADRYMTIDPVIIKRDNSQHGFYKTFTDYAASRVSGRVSAGRKQVQNFSSVLTRIQSAYGVPPEILITLWGMESSFGDGGNASYPILSSATTLAQDCRRPALFRRNLLSTLHLIESGEFEPNELRGQWAGEMSGLQFTPNNYWKYAVDFDGSGKREPNKSRADMFATAANMLKSFGWLPNQPYLVEVRVPQNMRWEDADLTVEKTFPMSYWQRQGVTSASGGALPATSIPGALMLPMGRLGPAFIAYPNFKALLVWNASLNNALTIGVLASQIKANPEPPISKGRGAMAVLTSPEIVELQEILARRGYDIGKIDGFIGTGTREAVRDLQLKMGLPADAYPTREFLNAIRR